MSEKAIALDPDRKKIILQAESLDYDKLIVATGGKPMIPAHSWDEQEGCFHI